MYCNDRLLQAILGVRYSVDIMLDKVLWLLHIVFCSVLVTHALICKSTPILDHHDLSNTENGLDKKLYDRSSLTETCRITCLCNIYPLISHF